MVREGNCKLLVMALSCAGLILHLGSWVVKGDSFNPKVLLFKREEPTAAKSLSQWFNPHDTEYYSFQQVSQCH
jgi:hypothetical protein